MSRIVKGGGVDGARSDSVAFQVGQAMRSCVGRECDKSSGEGAMKEYGLFRNRFRTVLFGQRHRNRTCRRALGASVLICLFIAVCGGMASAEDWPTYRHDNGRSGITTERLDPPRSERGVVTPTHPRTKLPPSATRSISAPLLTTRSTRSMPVPVKSVGPTSRRVRSGSRRRYRTVEFTWVRTTVTFTV